MGPIKLFLRRIVGAFRAFVGGGKARRLLRELKKADVSAYTNRIISDGVLLNQIPSPSEAETLRMDFIEQRLKDFGLSNIVRDEAGNVAVFFPAFGTRKDFMLVTADVGDAEFSALENSVRLTEERADGKGFGEASLGAAALLVLAEYAHKTGFHLDKNLLLLFTRSLSVDENYAAYRKFLEGWAGQISHAIVVRGTGLGVVDSRQIGGCRLSLNVKTPEADLLGAGGGASAAAVLGGIAYQLGGLSADAKKSAVVSIAKMEAGVGYGHWPSEGSMNVEVLSEDQKMLEAMTDLVKSTITRAGSGAELDLQVRSCRSVGDAALNERMVEALKATLSSLKRKPEDGVICEKVALLNARGVPSVAVGVSAGKKTFEEDFVELDSISTGFRQLLMMVERCAELFAAKEERKK